MQLHEQTRGLILLLIFFLFGPILTLVIIGGVTLRYLPYNARNWERSLSQKTGAAWTIQSVEYCSPALTRLHDVKILGETDDLPIFNAQQVDIQLVTEMGREKIFPGIAVTSQSTTTGLTSWFMELFPSWYSTDRFWRVSIPTSEVDFGTFSSEESALFVKNLLRKVSARQDRFSEIPIQFQLNEIAIASNYSRKKPGEKREDKMDIVRFVQGTVYRTPSEVRSDWSFQIKDVSEVEREQLSFVLSDPSTITFRTGKQPVPCDLAAVFCGMFKHFPGGSFQGEFVLASQNEGQSQIVRLNQAAFKNVPLAPLIRPHADVPIEGTIAELQLHQAEFGTGKMYAEGNLQVTNGAIAMLLLHRFVDRFRLTVEPETALDWQVQMIPFSASKIHFRIQQQGIDFWADELWRDAIMHHQADNRFPAWSVNLPQQRRMVTYPELMAIFAPDSAPVIPLTQGTQAIMPYIPKQ